jgi:hypothetical protein
MNPDDDDQERDDVVTVIHCDGGARSADCNSRDGLTGQEFVFVANITDNNLKLRRDFMVWKPGLTGNQNGRPRKYPEPPPGVNAKDFYGLAAYRDEYRNIAEQHGLEDPVLFQPKLLQDDTPPVGLRATITWISAKHQAAELEIKRLNATQDTGANHSHRGRITLAPKVVASLCHNHNSMGTNWN